MTQESLRDSLTKLAASNPAAWKAYATQIKRLYEGAVANVVKADTDGGARMAQGQLAVYREMFQAVEAVEKSKGA